jgi:hypothetical protein
VPTAVQTQLDNRMAFPCRHGVDALRRAVQLDGEGLALDDDEPWRACARVMCADARDRGVPVEQLLISLKRIWPTIPGIGRLQRAESSRMLSRVVTLCVEEYYAPLG